MLRKLGSVMMQQAEGWDVNTACLLAQGDA